jgi:hypothetical protein
MNTFKCISQSKVLCNHGKISHGKMKSCFKHSIAKMHPSPFVSEKDFSVTCVLTLLSQQHVLSKIRVFGPRSPSSDPGRRTSETPSQLRLANRGDILSLQWPMRCHGSVTACAGVTVTSHRAAAESQNPGPAGLEALRLAVIT